MDITISGIASGWLAVSFDNDNVVATIVRAAQGRRCDPDGRTWLLPDTPYHSGKLLDSIFRSGFFAYKAPVERIPASIGPRVDIFIQDQRPPVVPFPGAPALVPRAEPASRTEPSTAGFFRSVITETA